MVFLNVGISNAEIEQIFSTVTFTKTKLRSRIKLRMLEASLRMKTNLSFEKIYSKYFTVTQKCWIYLRRNKCVIMLLRKKAMPAKVWNCNISAARTNSNIYLVTDLVTYDLYVYV